MTYKLQPYQFEKTLTKQVKIKLFMPGAVIKVTKKEMKHP